MSVFNYRYVVLHCRSARGFTLKLANVSDREYILWIGRKISMKMSAVVL